MNLSPFAWAMPFCIYLQSIDLAHVSEIHEGKIGNFLTMSLSKLDRTRSHLGNGASFEC